MTKATVRTWPLWFLLACGTETLSAVDPPVGVFRPAAGCVVREEGGSACPSEARFTFEESGAFAEFDLEGAGLTNRRVSCERAFCGTGAFAFHANYKWKEGTARPLTERDRYGSIRHRFVAPVDLWNRTVTVRVAVAPFNTNLNVQVAIVPRGDRYRIIYDGPLHQSRGWHVRSAVVGIDNDKAGWDKDARPPVTLVPAELIIAVYLSTPVQSGDKEHWEGEIYVDDVGWR